MKEPTLRPPDSLSGSLAPVPDRDALLAAVMGRGRALRRRRRVVHSAPLLVLIALVGTQLVRTGGDERLTTVDRPDVQAPDRHGAVSGEQGGEGADEGRGGAPVGNPDPTRGSSGDTSPSPSGGEAGRPDSGRSPDGGLRGNYGAENGHRGCVVHNAGATVDSGQPFPPQDGSFDYSDEQERNDFVCRYDAIRPGGLQADGPWRELRITRGGITIDVPWDPAQRCRPTGFIQPGDHVYVDGRNVRSPEDFARHGYTTVQVGDDFSC